MYMILIHANNFGKLFHIVWCRDIIIHFSHVFNPSTFISLFLFASILSAESRRVFLDRDSSRMKLVIIVHETGIRLSWLIPLVVVSLVWVVDCWNILLVLWFILKKVGRGAWNCPPIASLLELLASPELCLILNFL